MKIEIDEELKRELGVFWWSDEDKFKVQIGANLSDEFARAFMRIGVNVQKIQENKSIGIKDLEL